MSEFSENSPQSLSRHITNCLLTGLSRARLGFISLHKAITSLGCMKNLGQLSPGMAFGPVKLIKQVKIAHSFLQFVSNQFHVIILSLPT